MIVTAVLRLPNILHHSDNQHHGLCLSTEARVVGTNVGRKGLRRNESMRTSLSKQSVSLGVVGVPVAGIARNNND